MLTLTADKVSYRSRVHFERRDDLYARLEEEKIFDLEKSPFVEIVEWTPAQTLN